MSTRQKTVEEKLSNACLNMSAYFQEEQKSYRFQQVIMDNFPTLFDCCKGFLDYQKGKEIKLDDITDAMKHVIKNIEALMQ